MHGTVDVRAQATDTVLHKNVGKCQSNDWLPKQLRPTVQLGSFVGGM
jgi:hypothetical protein